MVSLYLLYQGRLLEWMQLIKLKLSMLCFTSNIAYLFPNCKIIAMYLTFKKWARNVDALHFKA